MVLAEIEDVSRSPEMQMELKENHMKIPIYQIDAFTSEVFSGNLAAVCILDAWIDDGKLQSIAAENNLSETAYLVPNENGFDLRWFTPISPLVFSSSNSSMQ